VGPAVVERPIDASIVPVLSLGVSYSLELRKPIDLVVLEGVAEEHTDDKWLVDGKQSWFPRELLIESDVNHARLPLTFYKTM
jgi:hypothetical protein